MHTRVVAEQTAAIDPGRLGQHESGVSAAKTCAALMRHCASSLTSERWNMAPSDQKIWTAV
ncbi:hypothetical protein AWC01_03665 [Mycobacterium doricum]|uniref:Uncharacterized protein n=1 Tax=Mycolicibacterium doricum TaxID=126673 RepID=A0A1X1TIH5_9MYCO|nr:hypothetical protein AWC01_03665 [Mycolicibacterium doricum]